MTRTWHFGTPTPHQKECFTRVLKGQINMGTAVFPNKSKVNFLLLLSEAIDKLTSLFVAGKYTRYASS